jgi:hypothetical protein
VPLALGIETGSVIFAAILCVATVVILYRHRENLVRIFIKGTEIGFLSAAKGEHRVK